MARALLTLGLALGTAIVAVVTAGSASAVATSTVGLWNFNERSGPAIDSAGSRQNGVVGSLIQRTGSVYRFSTNTQPPPGPHEVQVANNGLFNPGTSDFAVTVRFKTGRAASNVTQKGQATTAGGYWKVEIHNGQATCLFKDGNGRQRAVLSTSKVNNGAFHVVRCDRSPTKVWITVDGKVQRTITGTTGNIANSSVLAIGGKAGCNPPKVGCDFFSGDIDYVRIQT